MKKNLLQKDSAQSIIKRVEHLGPDDTNLWGTMNATEMLLHCNLCNREIFEGKRGNSKTSLKQYLLRILALYIASNFTKGRASVPKHITKGKASHIDFEEAQREFIRLIKNFPLNRQELSLTHPAFGNISTKQWGIAAYKHMDHHLRQFGL